ncbi:MAG: class I SAM-dependent methyltransferase [Fuerstiella sp.]|nr:class I SAM-dependent methyltransferase [Fuerstiella sp.]
MFSQQVTPLHLARINDDAATSIDVSAVRNDVYLGPGYHVIRQFLPEREVKSLASHWCRRTNRIVRRYIKKKMLYDGCPNVSHLTPEIDRHFNYFWNAPGHQFTYLNAWRLQTLRNDIEGNPVNRDFLAHFPKNRVDPDCRSVSSFRIVTTRDGGAVKPHIDWPLDHSRIQFELMLSSYGQDYSGGLLLDDRFRGGCPVNICKQQKLQAGDLLIFRYAQRHSVQAISIGPSGRGVSRLMMPLESIPVTNRPSVRFTAAIKNVARRARHQLKFTNKPTVRPTYDETPYADGSRTYYDDEIKPLMNIAIDSGFPPSEVFYHKGLWARFRVFADWQLGVLQSHGLQQHHNFLDIGCGFMRLGMQLVPYLDDDRYCGVDPVRGYLDLADRYMKEVVQCDKRYELLASGDCDFGRFGRKFDFAMAHSVFTHMAFDQIQHCFVQLKRVMSPGGQFLFTVCLGDERENDFIYVDNIPMTHSRHRDTSFYETLALRLGFRFELLGREQHPTQFVCKATF